MIKIYRKHEKKQRNKPRKMYAKPCKTQNRAKHIQRPAKIRKQGFLVVEGDLVELTNVSSHHARGARSIF